MRRVCLISLLLGLAILLSACGSKGPLKLPATKAPATPSSAIPAPAGTMPPSAASQSG